MSTVPATALQTELPITDGGRGFAVPPGSRLLGPRRNEIEKIQKRTHDALKTLAHGDPFGPGADWAALCINECRDLWTCVKDARDNVRQAELGRDGYDTWPKADLAEHIMELRAVAAVLAELARAVDELRALEREEFNANEKADR